MMDFRSKLGVMPGEVFSLNSIDPAHTHGVSSREDAEAETARHLERLNALQYLLYADSGRSLLLIFQGMDAAGKDGAIRTVCGSMNPQGVVVSAFKQPSAEEAAHDFLWRAHCRTPGRGAVAIFNRSHYEDVLVVRVHELVEEKTWSARYAQINDFENILAQNGTQILKFFLHISADEQLDRFGKRLDDPARHWKISEGDYSEREYWSAYQQAYEQVLNTTSSHHAPWYVIPSNHKWFRNLAVAQIITETLEDMGLQLPPTKVDIADIQRKYHAAREEQHNGFGS